MQKTFVMIKPDGLIRRLTGEIINRIEDKGLNIETLKKINLDKDKAAELYEIHKGKPFYDELVNYVTEGPVVVMIVSGNRAIEIVRKLMGETDPADARPGTIRGDYGLDIERNLIHGSDSLESAEYEINLFFRNGDWLV